METEIIDYTIDKLEDIITPIGTLVWESYMKQMIMEGYIGLFIGTMSFIFFVYCGTKFYISARDYVSDNSYYDDGKLFRCVILLICMFITFLSILVIKDSVLMIYNPEYYVIQEILRSVGI